MKIVRFVIAFAALMLLTMLANVVLDVPADLPWWRMFGGWVIAAVAVYAWDRWFGHG